MKFELYQDQAKQWRWRLKASNGQIVGNSGEGYHNKPDCEHAINLVKSTNAQTPVVEEKPKDKK